MYLTDFNDFCFIFPGFKSVSSLAPVWSWWCRRHLGAVAHVFEKVRDGLLRYFPTLTFWTTCPSTLWWHYFLPFVVSTRGRKTKDGQNLPWMSERVLLNWFDVNWVNDGLQHAYLIWHLLVFRGMMTFRDTVQMLFSCVTLEDATQKWIRSTGPSVPVSWSIHLLGFCDIKIKLQWSNKSRCWAEPISWVKENDLPTIFMILIISVFQFWIMTINFY